MTYYVNFSSIKLYAIQRTCLICHGRVSKFLIGFQNLQVAIEKKGSVPKWVDTSLHYFTRVTTMIDIYNYITKIFVVLSVIVEAQEVKTSITFWHPSINIINNQRKTLIIDSQYNIAKHLEI